jgi:hypothetical protein
VAQHHLALDYIKLGRGPEAAKACRQAILFQPDYPEANLCLGAS